MKYQFIQQQRLEFPVGVLCEVLEVSESGYYEWRKGKGREPDRRQKEDEEITCNGSLNGLEINNGLWRGRPPSSLW
jgi:hypothetical protein